MAARAIIVAVGLIAAACGGAQEPSDAAATTTSSAPTTTAPATTTPPSTTTIEPDEAWAPPVPRVAVDGGAFVDRATGRPFVPRGVNYVVFAGLDRTVSTTAHDPSQIDADFGWLAERGYNTVRMFLDTCSVGPGCITEAGEPGVQGAVLDVLDEILETAERHGLMVVLTSNDLPDGGGYRAAAAAGEEPGVFAGYRNTDFLTAAGHAAIATYWDDLLRGLVDRRAALDVVLGWSILNEHWLFGDQPPLSLTSGSVTTAAGEFDLADPEQRRAMVVESTRALIATVADVIRSHAPEALVTMGFFAPDFPNETEIGGTWYVDTAPLVESSDLDFFDFHAYSAEDITLEQIAENFGIDDTKPVLLGETGAFVDRFPDPDDAALAVQRTIAESCTLGWDGWLIWTFEGLPLPDRTWGLIDAEGRLGEALAPINQPDPCVVTLTDRDLAVGATPNASRFLADEEPELALDGSLTTQWGSGDDAPQWYELAFATPVEITSIELGVAQWPAGRTRHEIAATRSDGSREVIGVLDGDTEGGDILVFAPDTPVADVIGLRITTTDSPSWVSWSEVSVFGSAS